MARKKQRPQPVAGWVMYLRTSDEEAQNPEASQERQRYLCNTQVLSRSDLPVLGEYKDVLTGKSPNRVAYQRMLEDARIGKFSHVVVERADRFGRYDTEAMRAIDELDQYGVSVRFANQPDLDPMRPDDRVLVLLTFALAHRESLISGLRIQGAAQTKRSKGGYLGRVPDGFISVEDDVPGRKKYAKVGHHIEQDPKRAKIWRFAWDLLLEDRGTLADICEALHAKGYTYRSGRPFIAINEHGKRTANANTLAKIFHNWTYAGWVQDEAKTIPPKTLKGDWKPIVSTEEFERGLAILARRMEYRSLKCKHDYLLKDLIYFEMPGAFKLRKLSGSTPNAGRANGGTPYYCVYGAPYNFMCADIDAQVEMELGKIQIDPEKLDGIRACYTDEIGLKLGLLKPDERQKVEEQLRAVQAEEERGVRLYVSGQITHEIYQKLWMDWQERQRNLQRELNSLNAQCEMHVKNLDEALEIIAKVALLYNSLTRGDQKELLRLIVERVIVNPDGKARLELRPPFAYLNEVNGRVGRDHRSDEAGAENKNTSRDAGACSGLARDGGQ